MAKNSLSSAVLRCPGWGGSVCVERVGGRIGVTRWERLGDEKGWVSGGGDVAAFNHSVCYLISVAWAWFTHQSSLVFTGVVWPSYSFLCSGCIICCTYRLPSLSSVSAISDHYIATSIVMWCCNGIFWYLLHVISMLALVLKICTPLFAYMK